MINLELLLGQLFVVGINGPELSLSEKIFLSKRNIGGVILFNRNYSTMFSLKNLITEIKNVSMTSPFISVDQEGGRVVRFKNNFTKILPMRKLAEQGAFVDIESVCFILGKELFNAGVNLNFSPCVDVLDEIYGANHVIGDRSFGSNSEVVSKCVEMAVSGLHRARINSCAKHFIGHGRVREDSHCSLPKMTDKLSIIEKRDLPPFLSAVSCGTKMVMLAHIIVEAFDIHSPASLSKNATEKIHQWLGSDILIITDDMEMAAISCHSNVLEASLEAILNGVDVLLFRNMQTAEIVMDGMVNDLKRNKFLRNAVVRNAERILSYKNNSEIVK